MGDAADIITKFVAPTLGVIMANCMFLTPMKAVLRVRKEERLGDLNPIPLLTITSNCMAWIIYGVVTKDYFVFFANQLPFMEGVFYTLSVYPHTPPKKRDAMAALACASAATFTTLALIDAHAIRAQATSELLWGLVTSAFLVIYYSSPLSTLLQVLRTRNSASFYWPLTLANGINGASWFIYGLAVNKPFLSYPNGFGALLAAIQMVLIWVFPARPDGAEAMSKASVHGSVQDLLRAGRTPSTSDQASLPPSSSVEDLAAVALGTGHQGGEAAGRAQHGANQA